MNKESVEKLLANEESEEMEEVWKELMELMAVDSA